MTCGARIADGPGGQHGLVPPDRPAAELSDLERDVLAHLHADPRPAPGDLAAMLDADPSEVRAALDRLVEAGAVERRGDELRPRAATSPAPGLLIATERPDAAATETGTPRGRDEPAGR